MSDTFTVSKREIKGTKHNRRLRRAGNIPVNLYGQEKPNENFSVPEEEVAAVIRHRGHLVELKGDATGKALLREVQWDTFGQEILHLDLHRVSADQAVEVELQIELRGSAPGLSEGGVVDQPVHSIQIECPVDRIPEALELTINDLHLGGILTAADLELPEGAKLLAEKDLVIAQCVEQAEEQEVEEGDAAPSEPEIIGRKAEDEESEGE